MDKDKEEITSARAHEALEKSAKAVTESDVCTVLDKSDEIQEKFEKQKPLARFVDDLKLLIALVKDYWSGDYRKIPYWIVAMIVAALLYILNPMDLLPDVIPILGYVDDATMMAACLAVIESELSKYRQWKTSREEEG